MSKAFKDFWKAANMKLVEVAMDLSDEGMGLDQIVKVLITKYKVDPSVAYHIAEQGMNSYTI